MIREVAGDILLTRAQVIAHGIAPHDHFDTGLALALRERWPSMVRDYRHAIHAKPLEAGEIWAWAGVDADGRTLRYVRVGNHMVPVVEHDGLFYAVVGDLEPEDGLRLTAHSSLRQNVLAAP